jgi:hypothetical protein
LADGVSWCIRKKSREDGCLDCLEKERPGC